MSCTRPHVLMRRLLSSPSVLRNLIVVFLFSDFGHPGFMDHPGDMGRGLQAAGNPGLKRKMIEQGGEPFPDKQARLSMADPPGAGHD